MCALLTKNEVKMDIGLVVCAFFIDLTHTIKPNELIVIWPKRELFSCGTKVGNPERANYTHFARSGSQSGFCLILPAHGFSHV